MNSLQRIPPLAPFEESPIRRLIMDKLRDLDVNAVCSYSALSAIAGCDIQREGRHILASAQKALLKERMVLEVVINVGVKRLGDVGIVDTVEHRGKKINRAVKRAARILHIADFDKLPAAQQARHRLESLRIGLLGQFSNAKAEKRLAHAIHSTVTPKQLAAAVVKSLEQFD